MKIKPVLHRILVRPDTLEEKTESGIILQLDKREAAAVETGTVLDIGSTAYKEFGTTAELEGIVPGTKVYFAKYAGKEVKIEDVRHLLLNDEDICGVIEND